MFDTHIHTTFSTDSLMKIEEAIERGRELGIGLVITEHMDTNYPDGHGFIFNPQEYFKTYNKYRGEKLLLGIELGMSREFQELNHNIIKDNAFDQVIGSLHFIGQNDLFHKNTYKGKNKKEVYEIYLKEMLDCLRSHSYIDALAHIDYICRYATYEDAELYYEEYYGLIDEILDYCIDNDIALEVNTRRFTHREAVNSMMKIYKRFSQLGGRYVTLGSDAHDKSAIGFAFNQALDLIEDFNLKAVYFKERSKEYF